MLTLPPSTRIFLCTQPCDMRRGFDGLLAEARRRCVDADPFAGHLFIFVGKRKHHIKVLYFQA
ncbi:MAG: IS66 family insertion sequence element accessory protein TnpB, partial [Deltaproteobacteria bacterium]|nr:IS66 family insertion sequence element accessory protein TnpB [Deltaproteobacteria bacterium]